MPLFEYCCFLHPQSKGPRLDSCCDECGRRFDFPLTQAPATINGRDVVQSLGRGFYGAVYKTTNPRTGLDTAIKVVPRTAYMPKEAGGWGKDFESEAKLHASLSTEPLVARLQDWGDETLTFGETPIECHWMEMEYIAGRPLADLISDGPSSPRQVAQIAFDLLDFAQLLKQRQQFHNDLHGENVLVLTLPDSQARRMALDPHVAIKVIDLGSAAPRSKEGPERLGDVQWVATHISTLLDGIERRDDVDPPTLRLTAQLRRIAEYWAAPQARKPEPQDFMSSIRSAYNFGSRPRSQRVNLSSVNEHYNAQSMPPWFAPELLHDPDGKWQTKLRGAGPVLVAGMRGCGKTLLFRSLEWTARLHNDQALEDDFLAVFVSCASLLRGPRTERFDAPIQRLFLAFAREVTRDVQACELRPVGAVNYGALGPFAEMVKRLVPWFEPPRSTVDVVELELSLSTALQITVPLTPEGTEPEFNTRVAFDELVSASRRLVDIWQERTMLFLLDDVSTRYLPADNVADMLSQFCLQSPDWGFKISTETQTLALSTPSGGPARRSRDYGYFDLGLEVFQECQNPRFVQEILSRRLAVTDGLAHLDVRDVLGVQSLGDIAETIRETGPQHPVYWGLAALTGMCVGDIGDVLQVFASILDRGRKDGFPVAERLQHEAAFNLSEEKLIALAGIDEWLYRHAIAFAQASHHELMMSTDRLRQYTRLFLQLDPEETPDLFAKIMDLVDAGIFVLTGGTTRIKSASSKPYMQFKLAYRNILGLTNRIPLSKRDRFEPPIKVLADWLTTPTAALLRGSGKATQESEDGELPESVASALLLATGAGIDQERAVQPSIQGALAPATYESPEPDDRLPPPRTLYVVTSSATTGVKESSFDWEKGRIVAAFGFEDRSRISWSNTLGAVVPSSATFIEYPDAGLKRQIVDLVDAAGVPWNAVVADDLRTREQVDAFLREIGDAPLMIDTTSLTKALIYLLVSRALITRGRVHVGYTSATTYFPPDAQLAEVVELIESDKHVEVQNVLDEMVEGELGPYRTLGVGPNRRDPSQPSIMATFVALKHDRVSSLLDDTPVEAIAAIAPGKANGDDSNRKEVKRYLARNLVQRYTGEVLACGAHDHVGTFELLRELHRRYALGDGYNFEIALTGTKMQTVGAAMLGATAAPTAVHYSSPTTFVSSQFTTGGGRTVMFELLRDEVH